MFSFFKKGSKKDNSIDEEQVQSQYTDISKATATLSVQEAAERAIGHEKLGVTQKYDRRIFEDKRAINRFHQSQFGDKKTVIGPNGEILHKSHSAAKRKYGDRAWQDHAAEGDHIDVLENIHKRHSNNPFLTDNDIKEVGNQQRNFQELSKRENGPSRKGKKSEKRRGLETRDVKRVVKGLKAESETNVQLAARGVKNATRTAHNTGKDVGRDAGAMALTTASIMNITAVVKGEKTAGEAISDTAVTGGKAAVTGYLTGGGLEVVTQVLSSSSSPFIQSLTSANVPAKVVTAVALTGGTLKSYFNGEISTQECILRLGETGVNAVVTGEAMVIGQTLIPIPFVGAAIGALVGSALSDKYCGEITQALQKKELEHQERLYLQEEYRRAAEQARAFRQELEIYLESYFQDCRSCFDEALSDIRLSFQSGNADGMIQGANKVTRKLGGTVHYETVAEFQDYLMSNSTDTL